MRKAFYTVEINKKFQINLENFFASLLFIKALIDFPVIPP